MVLETKLSFLDKMAGEGNLAKPKVEAILFDFDNTLVPTSQANKYALEKVITALSEYYSPDEAENIAVSFRKLISTEPVDPTCSADPHTWRIGLWERVLGDATTKECRPSARELYNLWSDSRLEKLVIDIETKSLLQQLKAFYRLAVITNADPTIQKEKLRRAGAIPLVETIVISGEQPKAKPHASIFHTACSLLSVPPDHCVMVGDSLHADVQGGLNVGVLATVWVNFDERELKMTDPKPHYTVRSIAELPRILEILQCPMPTNLVKGR